MKKKIFFKIIGLIIGLLALLYFGLFLFPQIVFNEKYDYKSFEIFSHNKVDQRIYLILDSAEILLSKSEFYKKNNIKQKIFVTSGFKEYLFWAFTSQHAFAVNQKLTNNIFLAQTDIPKNLIKRDTKEYNVRSLSGVIAHETTHSLLRMEFNGRKLAVWKNEGYCDYIANESSFHTEKGLLILCNNIQEQSGSFDYFKYRLYISYLIEEEHLTFEQILIKGNSIKELDSKIRNKYCLRYT